MNIFPSSLFQERDEETSDFYFHAYKNVALRQGIVLAVYEVEDEQNVSKLAPEYDVMTIEQDQNSGLNTSIYKNCVMIDGFGGAADFFQYKLRPVKDQKKTKSQATFKNETGSLVMLLCIDGISDKAIIVGSTKNLTKKSILTKEKGLHLEGEYNGVNYQINKDGELTITFRSATDDEGKPSNEEASGSFIKMDKDGSIELNDKNKESIKIDKKEKTITLSAEKDISSVTEANYNITAKESANINAEKDIVLAAQGAVRVSATKSSIIDIGAELTINAPTLTINGSDRITAKANNIQILGNQVIVGNGAAPAVVLSTLMLGTGNGGAPVVSNIIGPFSSSVLIGQ